MWIGPAPDAMEPGFQCVRTQWIRGFMPFRQPWRPRIMMLMVPERPECGMRAHRHPAATNQLSDIGSGADVVDFGL